MSKESLGGSIHLSGEGVEVQIASYGVYVGGKKLEDMIQEAAGVPKTYAADAPAKRFRGEVYLTIREIPEEIKCEYVKDDNNEGEDEN